jgi:iron complex outermembrane receptor protein
MTVVDVMKQAAAPRNLVGLAVSAIVAGVPLTITQTAHAQEASDGTQLEEVRVTGSRILRRDFESPSPIVTVGTEQLEQTSNVSLEASLNKLPQFVPALSQLVTGDIQPSATNTPGSATANLRGLGANRNLVLLDGKRAMPNNALLAIDLNSIPSAAIERVEVITGGASSTYGADAVGGVVNFILKKNFQGVTFDAQYGETEIGDAQEYRISALMGGNFGEGGRGNIMVGAEYTKRGDAFLVDREFYRNRYMDPTVAGTDFWWTETSYNPAGNLPDQAVVDSIFSGPDRPPGVNILNTNNFLLNDDGTLYSSIGVGFGSLGASANPSAQVPTAFPTDPGGTYRYNGPLDGLFRKRVTNGLAQNDLNAYVSTPLTRYSLFTRGSFQLTDRVSYFAQGVLSQSDVNTISQYSPAVGGWTAQIPYGNQRNCASIGVTTGVCQDSDTAPAGTLPFSQRPTLPAYIQGGTAGLTCGPVGGCTNTEAFPVSPELGLLLASRGNADAPWTMGEVFDWLPPRSTSVNTNTYQIVTGFEGELPFKDWTWEAYASHGQSTSQTQIFGVVSLDRYRAIVTSPNYGRGFVGVQNNNDLVNGIPQGGGGFAGARVTCTTGLPIMENFTPSQDCKDALSLPLQNRQQLDQTVYEANLQGGLFEWWAGEVRAAVGASYRENKFEYQTDGLTSINNFLDSAVGIFPLGDSAGKTSVKEAYMEGLIPLARDLPGIRQLNLEIGYRYSDYDPSGEVSTYKGLIDWSVVDFFRFRGGYQAASRAPNIGELFSGRTQTFTVTGPPTTDLCSEASTNPLSANPVANPGGAAAVRALCTLQMGAIGADTYYVTNGATQPAGPPGGLYQVQGNALLKEEEAKTWTAGFVLASPFDHPLASGLRLTVDYYSIELEDAITTTTGNQIMARCFNPALNPGLDPNNIWCQAMQRNPDNGNLAVVNALYSNEASYKTSGWDAQVDWRAALADMGLGNVPGTVSLNVQVSILDKFEEQLDANTPARDWKDFQGPNLTGITAGGGASYRYRVFTSLGYNTDVWGVTLRHRYLPTINDANELTNPGGNPIVGGDGLIAQVPKYNIFDLAGTYNFNQTLAFRLGVDNLFDRDPPVTGRNVIAVNGLTGGTLVTSGNGIYDPLGRRFYLGVRANF